jgi:hypothetical protein
LAWVRRSEKPGSELLVREAAFSATEPAVLALTGAWRTYNRLARDVDPTMVWPVDEDDLTG